MSEMPRKGDMVIYHAAVGEPEINGSKEHPAVVTRVWSKSVVNLRILTDGAGVEWRVGVERKGSEPVTGACWEPRE